MILDKPSYLSAKITNIIKIHNVIKRFMMNSAGKGPKLPNNPNSQNAKPQNNPLQTDSSQTPLQGFTPQDLTTPGVDSTESMDQHYFYNTHDKKHVQEQHTELQKQNYSADKFLKQAEEHQKINTNTQNQTTQDKLPTLVGGIYSGILADQAIREEQQKRREELKKIEEEESKQKQEAEAEEKRIAEEEELKQKQEEAEAKKKQVQEEEAEKKRIEEEEIIEAQEAHKQKMQEIADELKKINEQKNNDYGNIIPSKIYKNNSNKEYATELSDQTTPDNISDANLILEMKKRELIKDDPGNTSTTFKTQDNETVLVGAAKNKIKLSSLGQAYSSQISKDINNEKAVLEIAFKEISFEDLMIIPPPRSMGSCFIETGLQKHLMVVFDESQNVYVATHYCTSKSTGIQLCDKQLKIFQNEQENPEKVFINTKVQNIVPLTMPLLIKKDDVCSRVYMDKEYLSTVPQDIKEVVIREVAKIKTRPAQQFNNNGLTKEDCINICREHDATIDKKSKHPLTADQIKQNEQNKKKQQEDNKLKSKKIEPKDDKSD